ncbi:MAG TPA: S53 family peptidase [Solirubrobacteraceae bacterium]|nr:S53 family peptidase [Solirubrobacteraceae bacterium]
MRVPTALAACLALACLALAPGAGASTRAVARATAIGPAPASRQLTLVFPLVADDAGLRQFTLAVSTPGSALYGQFASVAQLAGRFGSRPAAAAKAMAYLRGLGARQVQLSPTRMYVQASMSVLLAQRAFGARLALMRDAAGQQFVAPSSVRAAGTLPAALRGVATGVVGLDNRPLVTAPQLRDAAVSSAPSAYEPRTGTALGCGSALATDAFTPNQYLTAYNYDALHRAGLNGGGERVAVIEIDGFKHSDLSAFGSCFGVRIPPIHTHTVGFRHPLAPGGETTLDLEVLSTAAPKLSSIDVYENQGDASNVLAAFSAPLTGANPAPQVISASLGICEQSLYDAVGKAGFQAIERDLELAASSGITVLAAAGDQGSSSCVDNNGAIVPGLDVSYPASSWFVTAVGGTNVQLGAANQITQEVVWNDGGIQPSAGGGGESEVFGRPPYQPSSIEPTDARALPDISLLADLRPGYAVYCTAPGDQTCGPEGWIAVGGTSAASPLLAGGLALVDQDLARRHHEPLGLVNPLVYALAGSSSGPAIFHDVTSGDNDLGQWINNGSPFGCCSAGAGFDRASGWGSLDLGAFDQAALEVMPAAPTVSLSLPGGQHPLAKHAIFARLSCSARCRAYVGGFLVWSHGNLVIHSGYIRLAHRGSKVFRIPLNSTDVRKARSALAARKPADAVLTGIAVDAQGRPLAVSGRKVLYVRG